MLTLSFHVILRLENQVHAGYSKYHCHLALLISIQSD